MPLTLFRDVEWSFQRHLPSRHELAYRRFNLRHPTSGDLQRIGFALAPHHSAAMRTLPDRDHKDLDNIALAEISPMSIHRRLITPIDRPSGLRRNRCRRRILWPPEVSFEPIGSMVSVTLSLSGILGGNVICSPIFTNPDEWPVHWKIRDLPSFARSARVGNRCRVVSSD